MDSWKLPTTLVMDVSTQNILLTGESACGVVEDEQTSKEASIRIMFPSVSLHEMGCLPEQSVLFILLCIYEGNWLVLWVSVSGSVWFWVKIINQIKIFKNLKFLN
jgi:hypothetical protein